MSKICCTAFSDRRLADHFGGKLHLGYMLIRDKLAELQEEKNKVHKERVEERRFIFLKHLNTLFVYFL
jgi:hypothetical protein